MNVEIKFTIEINNVKHELTRDEARALYDTLRDHFNPFIVSSSSSINDQKLINWTTGI